MKKITIENTCDVREVVTAWSTAEANTLLKKGWVLLHGGCAHQDNLGLQAKPVFILGLLLPKSAEEK